jgi:hypothetical protein
MGMPRLFTYSGALMIIVILGGSLLFSSSGITEHAQGQETVKPTVKWEYCIIWEYKGAIHVNLFDSHGYKHGKGWESLAEAIKAPLKGDEKTNPSLQMVVFNFLGAQGWELVGSHVTSDKDDHVYSFKRRREK